MPVLIRAVCIAGAIASRYFLGTPTIQADSL
jgi:hypothetical protein